MDIFIWNHALATFSNVLVEWIRQLLDGAKLAKPVLRRYETVVSNLNSGIRIEVAGAYRTVEYISGFGGVRNVLE